MKKLSSTLPNMLLSLTGICFVAAAILSFVDTKTSTVIAESKVLALEAAIGEVTPDFDNSPLDETRQITVNGDSLTIYPAKMNGELKGVAVESISHNGFGGDVRVLVGINADGSIKDYSVLEMNETPGLGDKMGKWFRDETANRSILGRAISDAPLRVSKDGGSVDAITAATISSRAFLNAVNKAIQAYKIYLQGGSEDDKSNQ